MEQQVTPEQLRATGFEAAAATLERQLEQKRKMTIAYEHYRFVTPMSINRFNEALKKRTLKRSGKKGVNLYEKYDQLKFTGISAYGKMPPADVLEKVAEAKQLNCFDAFYVAQIESVVEYKDPIVFGSIVGCQDRFFIAQWDNDVRIEDILKENEG